LSLWSRLFGPPRKMLETGALAPPVSFTGLDGAPRSLPAGPVVLAFFKVTCPTCQLAFPYLEKLARGSLRFLAVSQDNADKTERFKQHYGITFETVLDSAENGYAASNAFSLTNVPSLFLVEAEGTISWASTGFHKHDLEVLGERVGIVPFSPGEAVPLFKPG
jgi:peroxiredoxin